MGTPSHHLFLDGIFHETNTILCVFGVPPWLWKFLWNSGSLEVMLLEPDMAIYQRMCREIQARGDWATWENIMRESG